MFGSSQKPTSTNTGTRREPTVAKQLEHDIEDAREALAEGEAELTRLREAFLNGEPGVEWSHVKSQEGVVEYAQATIERIARQNARSAESLRQAALSQIAAEIKAYGPPEGAQAVALLADVEKAVLAFAGLFADHNSKVTAWRQRLMDAGVAPTPGRTGNVGILKASYNVYAGDRELEGNITAGRALRELLDVVRVEAADTSLRGQFDDGQIFHIGRDTLTTYVEGLTGGTVHK